MKNNIEKYLIENNQIRIYILSGKQIYRDTEALEIDMDSKVLLRKALNITALENALNTEKKRVSYIFSSKNRKSCISTESFSNGTITGKITLDKEEPNFDGGTLKTISILDDNYSVSNTSNLLLKYGNIYKDIEEFYHDSYQTETYIIPLAENQNNIIILVQPLPFSDKKTVDKVLNQINSIKPKLTNLNSEMLVDILSSELNDWTYLETAQVKYSCSCSKDKFLEIISSSMSKEELNDIISEKGKIEVACCMCGKKYVFTPDDIVS